MSFIWQTITGPNVYAILRPKGPYETNLMERLGNIMVYVSQLGQAVGWATSPFWVYYFLFRFEWSPNNVLGWAHFLLTYHSVAYGLRTAGRLSNPVYRAYIEMYVESQTNRTVGEKLLQTYDFEITSSAPTCFEAKDDRQLWYLNNTVDLPQYTPAQLSQLRFLSKICIHTFGRRMLYPGSVGILKTLLSQMIQQNRLKLMLEMGGIRQQLRTTDGNVIDTMFFDRRGPFPDAPLVICSDGNAGFYETGIARTPAQMDFSVLGWNPPGFAESTGAPYADQILRAMDCVVQFALAKGFRAEQIVLFGWSIGGFPSSWAAANQPRLRALILDATFDDVLPLALAHMPAFADGLVRLAIREQYNLNVALQLARFPGPVRIIRRFNDEIITTYQGADEARMRRENRGNHLLAKFLQARFPLVLRDNDDYQRVLDWVNDTEHQRKVKVRDALRSLSGLTYSQVCEAAEARHHLLVLLCALTFTDVPSSHTIPLRPAEFSIPEPYSLEPFDSFLNVARERCQLY